jgi:hypothetical protein
VKEADIHKRDPERLRIEFYNSSLVSILRCHDELMIMRVRPDRGILLFLAGQ